MTAPRVAKGSRGLVAAGHSLATADGVAALRNGGNAFDAAVAAAATLAVVAPHECGLGGDLFAILYDAKTGSVHALNASGRSPAAAGYERYRGGIPETGPLSVSVPGMVGGWTALNDRFGTQPLAELLAPGIAHAVQGFAVSDVLVRNIGQRRESISANAACRSLFLPNGNPLATGTVLRQPGVAETLRRLGRDGSEDFYKGETAASIVSEFAEVGGLISRDDLADFSAIWGKPISAPFCGVEVYTTPPNTWGAALLLQLMLLEPADTVGDEAQFLQAGMRARKTAYEALAGAIADPGIAGDRAARILCDAQDGRSPPPSVPQPSIAGSDTSQVICVDSDGNLVALLQSVSVPFGSGVYLPDCGVLLNNRLSGFNLRVDDANCIAPRKRPANTLVPVIALRNRRPYLACATPGGPGQTGTLAQVLGRVLARGETLAAAIDAPRWSNSRYGEWLIEDSAPAELRAAAQTLEPSLKTVPWGAVNPGSVAALMSVDGGWVGVTDTRRDASVAAC
jgi:gamma-glutamyltranspeptidase/glutathione hydrolase